MGPEIASLFKGERVLRPATMQVVLQALRSGALGRSQVLSSSAAQSVLEFVGTALDQVQGGRATDPTSSAQSAELYQILGNLPAEERARLDEILEELTSRAIQRALQRLEKIERLA